MTLLAVAVNGRGVVDPEEPVLRADDEALLRGRAAFETIRVYAGAPFKLAEHLDRLAASAERIGLPAVNRLELDELARQALDAAGAPDSVLRLIWTPTPAALALVSAARRPLRRPARTRAGADLAPGHPGRGAVDAAGRQVDELRGEHGGRGRGAAPGRRRRRLRRRGRDRAGGSDDERLVAARAHALHTLARARHPRRRHAGDGDRARRRGRLRRRGGRVPPERAPDGRRGLHLLVRARGDARHGARRQPDRPQALPPTSCRPL